MYEFILSIWQSTLLRLTLLLVVSGPQEMSQNLIMQKNTKMLLELKIQHNGALSLMIINKSSETQKIWELGNSWGWSSIHLELREAGSDKVLLLERKKTMIWSPNIPAYFTIAPHKSLKIQFNPADNTWEKNRDLPTIKNAVLLIKAILIIPESQESKELNVFTGKLESNIIKSKPPHKWLLPNE